MTTKTMRADDRAELETVLFGEVRKFLEEMDRDGPDLEDGEENTLLIRGGRAGSHSDNSPLYQLIVRHSQEKIL